MEAEQREELRRLAEAATPIATELYGDRYFTRDYSQAMLTKEQDAFLTAAQPQSITALLDELDRADESYALLFAENARLRSEVSACNSLVFAVESAMHDGVLPINVECAYDAMEAK